MKKISKKASFSGAVRESYDYLWESRRYIYFVTALFIIGGLAGFLFHLRFSFFDSFIRDILNETEGLGVFGMISFIFLNNLRSAFFGLFFGILFGVFPLVNAFFNGAILGYVFKQVSLISGFQDFFRIVPYGIFELPAIFISLGLGLKLGLFLFFRGRNERFMPRLKYSLLIFAVIVLPLLLIAGIIEGLLIFAYK